MKKKYLKYTYKYNNYYIYKYMNSIQKVNIKKILYDDSPGSSRLEFSIKGENINFIIVNTIRRATFKYIPIFSYTNYKFEKNTSIYHNNMLKLSFETMPVYGIKNNYDIYDEIELNKVENLTMYINYVNNEKNNKIITTDDVLFYYQNKSIQNPYKILPYPITILKLRENEEINCTIMTTINCENNNDANINNSAVSISTYKEINDNEYNFILESRGQLSEKRILIVAIKNIVYKLNKILINVIDPYEYKDHTIGTIKLKNEEYTMGNLLTDALQDHKNIEYAGYRIEHPLINNIFIDYKTNNDTHIKIIFKDIVTYYEKLFNSIENTINDNI